MKSVLYISAVCVCVKSMRS